MVDTSQARQQIEQARQALQEKRSEAQQAEALIQEAKAALPSTTSQEALRSKFAGLQGRNQRRQIEQAQGQLSQQEQEVEKYKQELAAYEENITQAEREISSIDAEQEAYDAEQEAYEVAKRYYNKGGEGGVLVEAESPAVRRYYAEMVGEAEAQEEFNAKLDSAVSKFNQGVPESIAFKGFNVDKLKKQGVLKFEDARTTQTQVNNLVAPILAVQETQDLKSSNASVVSGLSIQPGMVSGGDNRSNIQPQSGNRTGSWISRFISGGKEGAETIQTYGDLAIINNDSTRAYNLSTGRTIGVVSAAEPRTIVSQIKEKIGSATGGQTPTSLIRTTLGSERPSYQRLTAINTASDIAQVPLRLGTIGGNLAEQSILRLSKSTGIEGKYTMKAYDYIPPQKITVGGEQRFKVPEHQRSIAQDLSKGANLAGNAAAMVAFPGWSALGTIAKGTETVTNPRLSTGQRVVGGVEVALGASYFAVKGYFWATKPRLNVIQPGGVTEPRFVEYQKTIQTPKGPKVVSRYKIIQETIPPQIRIENKLFTLYEGEIGKANKYITSTPFITGAGESVGTFTFRVGAKFGTYSIIDETAPNYLISEKFFRVSTKPKSATWIEPGRRISRFETTSVVRKTIDTADYEISEVTTFFKDRTFPTFKDSAKKVDTMKGIVVKEKQSLIELGDDTTTNFIIGSGRKSSSSYLNSLYQKQETSLLSKVLPKRPSTLRVPKNILKAFDEASTSTTASNTLALTSASAYAGTGQYEKTEGGLLPSQKFEVIQKPSIEVMQKEVSQLKDFQTLSFEQPLKSSEATKVSLSVKQSKRLKQPERLEQSGTIKLSVGIQSKSLEKMASSQSSKSLQSNSGKPKPKQPSPPKNPTAIRVPSNEGFVKRMLRKVREEPETFEAFEAFADMGGKPKSLGKKGSQTEAESLLKSVLKGTLRAGGFVTKSGSPIKSTELKSFGGGEFTTSKRSLYKIIQKKEKRLGTGSETREIQYFKKKSGKNRSFLGF